MSEFWSESLIDVVDDVPVCAICGRRECGDEGLRPDPRETQDSTPVNNVDEPSEETR